MTEDIFVKYKTWCEKVTEEPTKTQLKEMENDETLIENSFFKDLEFGTGGLRGILGAGTNCLNNYTIRRITKGIANAMNKKGQTSVVITYDSRLFSREFSFTSAEVFADAGIKAYVTKECQPTPFLSFAVRSLKTDIGINVTASHNPSKYNGYKVYNSDGCQFTDKGALELFEYIKEVDPFEVKTDSFENYLKEGKIEFVSEELITSYIERVKKESLTKIEDVKVCYTPLNGAGHKIVPKLLTELGVKDLNVVKEQGYPDGNFLTCSYPNPEKKEALKLGIDLLKETNGDILVATDPDADRMGVAVKNGDDVVLLTGNEMGVIFFNYILNVRKELKNLPKNPVVVKTIVTTKMIEAIAKKYGVNVINVLTGFKYIGSVIKGLEDDKRDDDYLFGFEESYGYLKGSYVRDKDGVVAAMLAVETCAYYKKQGKTLVDVIEELYKEYGYYENKLFSYEFAGASGAEKLKNLLDELREKPIKNLGDGKVVGTIDYLKGVNGLPKSNVLVFVANNGTEVVIRPSGTEPLVKIYLTVSKTKEENAKDIALVKEQFDKIFA
ncbi:MAG: phospho-sugar mutase [Clostridiales bacterium]|nr:phospho-sugar mutase [Clostridiales bacterium]